MQDKLYVLNP